MKAVSASAFLLALLLSTTAFGESSDSSSPALTFERDVRPILKTHCFHCHGEADEVDGDLDVRLRRLMVAGGYSGPAIVPGKPDESYLYERLAGGEMPPEEIETRPTAKEIETVRRWIALGAPTARPEPESVDDLPLITEEERQHWAFLPIRRPDVPPVQHGELVRNPIDAFLLEKLEAQGLSFAPEADRQTLIRRAYFDLIGLPPTPEQVDAFVADPAPDAYERLIDELLSSRHYGERWGRHWLDVAGYADSEGYNETDTPRPYAYKYRDYVIRAFNADKPFDQFLREQLAGDEMIEPPYNDLQPEEIEKLVATGFLRMAPDGTGSRNDDPDLAKNEVIAETIKIVSSSLLGLTVGCAQCHDHRFDPILQKDYYRLRAVLEPALDWKNWRSPRQRQISLYTAEDRKRAGEVSREAAEAQKDYSAKEREYQNMVFENEIKKIPEELRKLARETWNTPAKKRTPEQKKLFEDYPNLNVGRGGRLRLYLNILPGGKDAIAELDELSARVAKIRAKRPPEDFIRALTEVPDVIPATYVFERGDREQPGERVDPGDLTVLAFDETATLPADNPELPTTGRRLAYAKRLTDGNHPLTPRVLVNRFWMHHFGRGIVETPGDFGTQGMPPSHPELLDWLASEFIDCGWSLKTLHRVIMTSTAYRQSSELDERKTELDPDNRLYGRMPVRRLEAEVIRDAILAASGALDLKMFGPAVAVKLDDTGQVIVGNAKAGNRRSVYVQVRRSQPLGVLATFDAPAMEPNCEMRTASTVAPQALLLMNSAFILEQAERFAARVQAEAGDDLQTQALTAWRLAYATQPTDQELKVVTDFLHGQYEESGAVVAGQDSESGSAPSPDDETVGQALTNLGQVLFGTNQFLYVN